MIQGLGPTKVPRAVSIGDCLKWVTTDPRWLRALLIGGVWNLALLLLLPAVVLLGHGAQVLKASFRDERATIPGWTPFGPLLLVGFRILGIMAVHYFLAAVAVWAMLLAVTVPEPPTDEVAAILYIGAMSSVVGLALLAFWLFGLYVLTAIGRAVVLDRWTAAFEVVENLNCLRRNVANYGRFLVIMLIVSTLLQFSPLLCFVGLFPAAFWMQCTMNYSLGRLLAADPALGS